MDYPYTRPQGEYTNTDPQQTKYQNDRAANIPVSDVKIDGDFNKLTDAVNDLKDKIDDAVIAGIDGATDLDNEGKLVSTSGTEITWIYAGTEQIEDRAITFAKIKSGTHGALLAFNETQTLSEIAVGNQGEVLTSNGAAHKPTYQTLANLFNAGANQNKVLISEGANVGFSFVTNDQIEDNTISGGKITDASIVANVKLQDLSITTAKIADLNITTNKIADGAVTDSKIGYDINGDKLTSYSVAPHKIAIQQLDQRPGYFGFMELYDGIASPVKRPEDLSKSYFVKAEVDSPVTRFYRIVTADLDAGVVKEPQIDTNAVTTTKIADDNVTNDKLASGISTSKLSGTARQIIATNDAGAGTSIALNTTTNKVLCSKTAAPYAEFRSLTQNDLPQLGMQPIYMARWSGNAVTKSYALPNSAFVTSFAQGTGDLAGVMVLTFNQVQDNFIVVASAINNAGQAMYVYTKAGVSQLTVNQMGFVTISNAGTILVYKPS